MSRIDRILSEQLRKERNKFADFRHGGVVLSSADVEDLVQRLHCYIDAAEAFESALASLRPIDPAELRRLVPPASATVLHLMRPGSNIVPFQRPTHDA